MCVLGEGEKFYTRKDFGFWFLFFKTGFLCVALIVLELSYNPSISETETGKPSSWIQGQLGLWKDPVSNHWINEYSFYFQSHEILGFSSIPPYSIVNFLNCALGSFLIFFNLFTFMCMNVFACTHVCVPCWIPSNWGYGWLSQNGDARNQTWVLRTSNKWS